MNETHRQLALILREVIQDLIMELEVMDAQILSNLRGGYETQVDGLEMDRNHLCEKIYKLQKYAAEIQSGFAS